MDESVLTQDAPVLTSPDALHALKSLTRPLHERLENAPRLERLLDPSLTREEYGVVLERLFGYQEPAEHALEAYAEALPVDVRARRKSHLLRRDLEALGYSREDVDEIPRCPYVAPVTGIDSALGVLYVLEGSTLGGRIIRRHVERSIHVSVDSGAAYYAGYGSDTGIMWKALGQAINHRAAKNGSTAAMVAAARATFIALNQWMTR